MSIESVMDCVELSGIPSIADAIEFYRFQPQAECPLEHRFQDGVYVREITMPTGARVIGHVHKHRHLNIVVSGFALVSMNGAEPMEVKAGDVFYSDAGVQKLLVILDEMKWLTIHANPENVQDIAVLEDTLIEIPEAMRLEKGSRSVDDFRMSVNAFLCKEQECALPLNP